MVVSHKDVVTCGSTQQNVPYRDPAHMTVTHVTLDPAYMTVTHVTLDSVNISNSHKHLFDIFTFCHIFSMPAVFPPATFVSCLALLNSSYQSLSATLLLVPYLHMHL